MLAGESDKHFFYIAMAGSHQIWKFDPETTVASLYCGNICGKESSKNGDFEQTCWAQPSGLSLVKNQLFVADAESSSVRVIDLDKQKSRSVVGGERYALNLMVMGDVDGKAFNARLQHPMHVLWIEKIQQLMVADAFNHKLRLINPVTNTIVSWIGNGKPGLKGERIIFIDKNRWNWDGCCSQ